MSEKKKTATRGARSRLTPERIMAAAASLIDELGWERFSMRALGRAIGVDPMAIYHYFESREALLSALVVRAFEGMDPARPPFLPDDPWPKRVELLVECYLRVVSESPELTMLLARGIADAEVQVAKFRKLVVLALEELRLPPERIITIADLLADYVHGFAIAPGTGKSEAWRPAIAIVIEGIREASVVAVLTQG